MPTQDFKPGTYTVSSSDGANVRREPRIVSGPVNNIVGHQTPGTQVEVYEIYVDNTNMVWGRVSAPDSTGKAKWICIDTGNRMLLKPTGPTATNINGKKLTIMIDNVVVYETILN